MTAVFSNIDMFTGETPTLEFTVYNAAKTRIDLTNASIQFVVQKSVVDGSTLINKSVGNGIVVLNQTLRLGIFDVIMDAADTAKSTPGTYYFEARVTLAGITLTAAFGNLKLINSAF